MWRGTCPFPALRFCVRNLLFCCLAAGWCVRVRVGVQYESGTRRMANGCSECDRERPESALAVASSP